MQGGIPAYASLRQPSALWTRSVEAGYLTSMAGDRVGRGANPPPQLGQTPPSTELAQAAQKVHSKEQISAPSASAGRSLLQHSQLGLICSTTISFA